MQITLSEELNNKLMAAMSGSFLTEHLPEDWHTHMDETDVDDFVDDHVWEPFEGWPASEVWSLIDGARNAAAGFIERNFMDLIPDEMKSVLRCVEADLIGSLDAYKAAEADRHDWAAHQKSLNELQEVFPFLLEEPQTKESQQDE